jgi:uncharacterized BrkB/YihY/UPF0761 family membrane protein
MVRAGGRRFFDSLTWFAGSVGLSCYFANFANYSATYGSLGAAIGTMMWTWMSAIVLFGAELNSEIEHQTARDITVGKEKLLGSRGATMADTVGGRRHRRNEHRFATVHIGISDHGIETRVQTSVHRARA